MLSNFFNFADPSRKQLKDGELPTLNLPKKSVHVSSLPPRASSSIQEREESQAFQASQIFTPSPVYRDFADFKKRIINLQLGIMWIIVIS